VVWNGLGRNFSPQIHGTGFSALLRFDDVTAPDGINMPRWVYEDPQRRTVMSEITTVGLDLAKNVFQVHGADASGRAELRKKLRRDQVLAFFSQLQPCVVAMEACGGAHFWGREIGKLGHEVRLIWRPRSASSTPRSFVGQRQTRWRSG
jgi:hypothetical protein